MPMTMTASVKVVNFYLYIKVVMVIAKKSRVDKAIVTVREF